MRLSLIHIFAFMKNHIQYLIKKYSYDIIELILYLLTVILLFFKVKIVEQPILNIIILIIPSIISLISSLIRIKKKITTHK